MFFSISVKTNCTTHVTQSQESIYPPEHLVWSVLMVKPALHVEHMAAPCLVQAAPVLGEPFGQLHTLADTHTHKHTHTHTKREKEREKEREMHTRVCVSVCVLCFVC